ncbi:hypothetical protein BDV95DRAFT_7861 [Massariosphaeria phaeospora]|uniref:Uncharacterized protein n=1 Tax=Massariosphaeria phaeospora TaxID=100035 RepID=A0A7C8MGV9_9PLEO|nr:hypothetical protein BDV95DRAFT_7861 [Massariosphaeria phaeospora]
MRSIRCGGLAGKVLVVVVGVAESLARRLQKRKNELGRWTAVSAIDREKFIRGNPSANNRGHVRTTLMREKKEFPESWICRFRAVSKNGLKGARRQAVHFMRTAGSIEKVGDIAAGISDIDDGSSCQRPSLSSRPFGLNCEHRPELGSRAD